MKRHATLIAQACGRTFDEAMTELSALQRTQPESEKPTPRPQIESLAAISPNPLPPPRTPAETPPTTRFGAFGPLSQRVAERLRVDPTIGTRQLAREIGCAANLAGRCRKRLGLPSASGVHTRRPAPSTRFRVSPKD